MLQVLPELTPHERRVKEMMAAFGQHAPDSPEIPDEKTRILRVRLLMEEVLEFAEAFAVQVSLMEPYDEGAQALPVTFGALDFDPDPDKPPSLSEAVDALADISVVAYGAAIACGVRMTPLIECVDANNLQKVARGHTDPVTGKFIKPADHKPPNLKLALALQGYVEGLTAETGLTAEGFEPASTITAPAAAPLALQCEADYYSGAVTKALQLIEAHRDNHRNPESPQQLLHHVEQLLLGAVI